MVGKRTLAVLRSNAFRTMLSVLIIILIMTSCNDLNPKQTSKEGTLPNSRQIYWGMDTAQSVTSELYACVKSSYGKPDVWGRYFWR